MQSDYAMPTEDEQIRILAYRDYCERIVALAYRILVKAVPLGDTRHRGFGQGFTEGPPTPNWLT